MSHHVWISLQLSQSTAADDGAPSPLHPFKAGRYC